MTLASGLASLRLMVSTFSTCQPSGDCTGAVIAPCAAAKAALATAALARLVSASLVRSPIEVSALPKPACCAAAAKAVPPLTLGDERLRRRLGREHHLRKRAGLVGAVALGIGPVEGFDLGRRRHRRLAERLAPECGIADHPARRGSCSAPHWPSDRRQSPGWSARRRRPSPRSARSRSGRSAAPAAAPHIAWPSRPAPGWRRRSANTSAAAARCRASRRASAAR